METEYIWLPVAAESRVAHAIRNTGWRRRAIIEGDPIYARCGQWLRVPPGDADPEAPRCKTCAKFVAHAEARAREKYGDG